MTERYDFIVVGGGTAGCLLAANLAAAATRPSVLIIEAGNHDQDTSLHSPFDRFRVIFARTELNYGYMTTPQTSLNNRRLPYYRGKGLGGSSLVNFLFYLYGSKEDYNRWADVVGDDAWNWDHVKEALKKVETYHTEGPDESDLFAKPAYEDHGHEGPVHISLPPTWEMGTRYILEAGIKYGMKRNLDLNSGNPIGIGIVPSNYANGKRVTSASANLSTIPDNLTIWTNSTAGQIIFDGKKAVGVHLRDGRTVFATKDIVLTAGPIDTPKLLLLSGIGPQTELEKLGIQVVHALEGVGKHLLDRTAVFTCALVEDGYFDKHSLEVDSNRLREARMMWEETGSGPLSVYNSSIVAAFTKIPRLLSTPEYKMLEIEEKEYIERDSVPHFEMIVNSPLPPMLSIKDDEMYLTYTTILMRPQSVGSLRLSSANPDDFPVIDLNLLDHAFDKRSMIEAVRDTMKFQYESDLGKIFKRYLAGPKSESDEDIMEYLKSDAIPAWHACGTVAMGKSDNPNSCVDSNLHVFGLGGLRVADLSICPILPGNHPQSTAYFIGQIAADKIIQDWNL
ncbi:GMC oxidoreductase [Lipomyces kononenkoae]